MLELLPRFGLAPGRLAPEHPLPGSPERCIRRWAVADETGGLWMLERIAPGQVPRREALGRLLAELSATGQPAQKPALAALIPAYRGVAGGGFVLREEVDCAPGGNSSGPVAGGWQLSPYVPGLALPRPEYLDEAWRGEALAEVILLLRRAGERLVELPPAPTADLVRYRDELFATIEHSQAHSQLLPRLGPFRAALEQLPALLAAQPPVLAHGDLHPLNAIWGKVSLRAVIDWEFAGARPLLYDAACCIGCAGFEHPSALGRGFVLGLILGLRRGGIGAEHLRLLPGMVLASRLGWLSEWLRKGDAEMLDMELDYLDILLNTAPALQRLWPQP